MLVNNKDETSEKQVAAACSIAAQLAKDFGMSPKDLRASLKQRFDDFGKKLDSIVGEYSPLPLL